MWDRGQYISVAAKSIFPAELNSRVLLLPEAERLLPVEGGPVAPGAGGSGREQMLVHGVIRLIAPVDLERPDAGFGSRASPRGWLILVTFSGSILSPSRLRSAVPLYQ